MNTLPNPRGYLIAPILVPSLHVLFTPLWTALGGQPELVVLAMAWQSIAWFGLMAACLATLSPALWMARNRIAAFPHKSLGRRHKILMGIGSSALASLLLMGPSPKRHSTPLSWLVAYFASACFLSGIYTEPGATPHLKLGHSPSAGSA